MMQDMGAVVSHKWVHQVLGQRGIPSPGLPAIEKSIAAADNGTRREILGLASRVEGGTEAAHEIDQLLSLIARGRMPGGSPQSPVTAPAVDSGKASPSTSADRRNRPKHHIYGAKGALTIEMDYLRQPDADGGLRQTVSLEAAVSKGPKIYDWEHKIVFQFMRRELPLLACALLGWLKRPLELKNHGQQANKSVSIEDQAGKVFAKVREGARVIAVPVGPPDLHAWLELVIQVMSANAPAVGEAMQLAMLRRVADMENADAKTA